MQRVFTYEDSSIKKLRRVEVYFSLWQGLAVRKENEVTINYFDKTLSSNLFYNKVSGYRWRRKFGFISIFLFIKLLNDGGLWYKWVPLVGNILI